MIIEYKDGWKYDFSAAGCACGVDEELLLIQRQQGKPFGRHWAFPSGKVEKGESAPSAARRELFEEVGIEVNEEQLVELSDVLVGFGGVVFRYTSFACVLPSKPVCLLKLDEVAAIEWANVNSIRKDKTMPFFWNTVREFIRWRAGLPLQPRLLPMPQARGMRHNRMITG